MNNMILRNFLVLGLSFYSQMGFSQVATNQSICKSTNNPFYERFEGDLDQIVEAYEQFKANDELVKAKGRNQFQTYQNARLHPQRIQQLMIPFMKRSHQLEADYAMQKIHPLAEQFAWAIPDEVAIQSLLKYAPLVEIGAGKGYWAHLLSQHGVDIVAYDNKVASNQWFPVQDGDERAVLKHQDRTLLLCWPPIVFIYPLASKALSLFTGDHVIYIGENEGGAQGDPEFFKLLRRDFKLVESVDIPNWPGYSDKLKVYKRKL